MVETKTPAAASLPLSPEGQSMYSDVYKDVYGFRPRLSRAQWDSLTEADFEALLEDHKNAMDADWHRDQEAIRSFVNDLRIHLQYLPFGAAVRSVLGIEYEMNDHLRRDEIEAWFFVHTGRVYPYVTRKLLKWSYL